MLINILDREKQREMHNKPSNVAVIGYLSHLLGNGQAVPQGRMSVCGLQGLDGRSQWVGLFPHGVACGTFMPLRSIL
jgi:hypothetical protein